MGGPAAPRGARGARRVAVAELQHQLPAARARWPGDLAAPEWDPEGLALAGAPAGGHPRARDAAGLLLPLRPAHAAGSRAHSYFS